jgi:GNAT superfamily N-acetyltransferase
VTPGAEETGELERVLAIPATEVYIWDCGTVPEYRRQGHYTALLNRILAALHVEGVPRAWIGASRLNIPSIRGIANAGFQHVLDLTYRRIGRLTWIVTHRAEDSDDLVRAAREILLKPDEWVFGRVAIGWQG